MLAAHGRWCEVKTARQYVDEAMCDRALAELSPVGASRVKVAMARLPHLLASLWKIIVGLVCLLLVACGFRFLFSVLFRCGS